MRTAAACVSILLTTWSLAAQEKVDFTAQIAPILVERCIECHGPKEQKGDLRLDARAHAFVDGEEDFWTIRPGEAADSELVRRLGLPLDDEEIMPNKGEPLTKEQQALMARWVAEGADWPAAGDEWIQAELAAREVPKITFELPAVDAQAAQRIDAAIAALKERGAVVQRVAADTAAVEVNLSLLRGKADDELVAMLRPLAPVLVWLNVSRTAISDAGADHLAALVELRRLNVSGTKLSAAALASLVGLARLEHLNAYDTALDDAAATKLAGLPKLRRLYAWQSKVSEARALLLAEEAPQLVVDLGLYVEQRLAAAEREIAAREQRTTPINDTCPVLDKPVKNTIFSLHEGRRVAFCCPKCKAAFDQEPAKYAGKLPAATGADERAGKGADDK